MKMNEDVKCVGCQTIVNATEKSKSERDLKMNGQKRPPLGVIPEQKPEGGGS